MLIYKTFEEFNRFFHQPMHYPTIKDIETYLGNKDSGAYSAINEIYYKVLPQYLPKEIEDKFGEEDDPLENPEYPYYYKVKNKEVIKPNLIVIRTENPEILKTQYEKLGFQFDYHRHGNGPFHYASEQNGFVFEIYPLTKSMEKPDNSLRLGFEMKNLNTKITELENSDWKIISEPKDTDWGLVALIQDLDGRKIELKNK